MAILDKLIQLLGLQPNHKRIAKQLRKPSGAMAFKVAQKMNESNSPLYDFAFQQLKPEKGEHLLEIGFANGYFMEALLKTAEQLRVSGLDYSPEMLKSAKAHNYDRIESGALTLRLGNSDAMPFEDAVFDKVFCINVIYFWDDPVPHLQEIQRVLKPGGRFFSIIRSKETMEMLPFTKHGFKVYEASAWEAILKENGFVNSSTVELAEAPVFVQGNAFQLKSLCISASKA